MRVGMIMDTSFPPDTRVENEARALMESGYEIYLYHIDYENRAGRETVEGVKIFRKKGSRMLYKLSALVYTVPFFRWMVQKSIRDFIRESKIDMLHIHDMVIAEAVFAANRGFQLPAILDLHENRPEIMELYKHVNQWPGRWLISLDRWRRKQRELMQLADRVILVTEEARQRAAETDGIPMEKTAAVPNVVRLDCFDTTVSDPGLSRMTDNKFTLLYIGDTSVRRGTMTVLQAVDLLKQQIPELLMLFVGSSSQDNVLHAFVKERGLSGLVRFEGWQEPVKLPAYINASDVCLSPLLRNVHHDTTYANKLFQYMACGKPVAASDCPAQSAVIKKEECGLIHKADDPEDLARVILEFYQKPEEREFMGGNGARAVQEKWNWDVAGKKLLSVYENIRSR